MYDMFKMATFASGAKFESLFETVLLFLTSSIVLTSFVYGIPDSFFQPSHCSWIICVTFNNIIQGIRKKAVDSIQIWRVEG